ncbi:MAG: hypothetical protein ACYS9X_06420, partial [Planctomycetota bacterium]
MLILVYALPFVTVGLFHKLGELADADRVGGRRGFVWGAASAGVWCLSLFVLRWSFFAGLALQAGLLVALFVLSTIWAI